MTRNVSNSAPLSKFSVAATVSVLTCLPGHVAAKRHTLSRGGTRQTVPFNAGIFFHCEERAAGDIHALHAILVDVGDTGNQLILRGRLNPTGPRRSDGRVRRKSRPDLSAGETEPWFLEQSRLWVAIDFDKVENPDGLDPATPEAMGYLRKLLPREFQGVACSYALSASAGMSDTDRISGHLWFYLDRPVGSQELKAWLRQYGVDTNLFQAVQPHYIAPPIFGGGLSDPVPMRKGLLEGDEDVVAVPEIDPNRPNYISPGNGAGLQTARGYEAKMALLGDGDGKEGCHGVITPAIASYMTRHGPQADREALKADIRLRAHAAPWDRSKHSEEYVAHEISDEVLDRSIQDWVDKSFVQREGYAPSELDNVNVARAKVEYALDRFVFAAKHWHGQHGYRQAMLEGRLRSYCDADGELALAYDGEPGSSFFGNNEQTIRQFSPPPKHGLEAQVALGKTEAVLMRIPELVSILRPGHCVLIAVPNHKLSRELEQRAHAHSLDVEVYLGPAQGDPDQPDKTMCWIPDQFSAFQMAGIGGKLCKVCPHRLSCGFQKQRRKKSQVWIAAHQVIYRKRIKPIPPTDFVVVDEDPLAAGLEGENPKQPKLLLCDDVPDDIQKAIQQLPIGKRLNRTDFEISDFRLRERIKRTYRQMRTVHLPEAPSQGEIDSASVTVQGNARLVEQAGFYRAILNDGPWGMRALRSKDGSVALHWVRQRRIHSDFDVPMLVADATAQWDATRHLIDCDQPPSGYKGETWIDEDGSIAIDYDYPPVPIIGPITVAKATTPHVSYRQVLFSGAASKFNDGDTGANNVMKVRRYIEARSICYRRVLVICQLKLKNMLLEPGLPPNVETAHLNSIRGRDEWKDIDLLIVIGRTQPPPAGVELQAEALFREQCKTLGPEYYEKNWMPLSGTDVPVSAECHPDPRAELMRWGVCEAELIQAIGRGRGVNRTADTPLQVDLINHVPLPDIEINEVVAWEDAQPDARAVITGRFGLLLPADNRKGMAPLIAALLPDLYDNANAARQAGVYSQAETPNRYSLLGVSAHEYISGPTPRPVALKAPGCRFAVPAYAIRPPTRRPLATDEAAPKGADINDEGVLMYGPAFVLKNIPRRLKSCFLDW
jgi:hypothetical protein